MIKQLVIWILILVTFNVKGQEFIDTIFTLSDDTILCNITLINNYNIFYDHKVKKRRTENTFIPKNQVYTYVLNNKDVTVQESEQNVEPQLTNKYITFYESDGVIYCSNIEKPPKYPGGINNLYSHLEEYVKVLPRDKKIFGNNVALVLYELLIMSDGKIKVALVRESSVYNCGFETKAELLENEILKQIYQASDWEPGIIDGEKVNMNIYLPLKFIVDDYKIHIYPSKYLFIFKNRRKIK